ncbi:MAG: hypothetical protein A2017_18280 [Lentisphaerae bacterium GWF2_44_16]|nr:MAG: hypothetical protein A2017_18280 [Lentisphaerae bacterium GWF2_44_16]
MAETVSSYNPEYKFVLPDWRQMRDTYGGQRIVKDKGEIYLPMTEGQRLDPNNGKKRYESYQIRANYFNYLSDTVNAMLGVMFSENPETLKCPVRINNMIEQATPDGENITSLMRRVNENQLVYGRYGLLLDIPKKEGVDVIPMIIEYPALKIVNWYVEQSGTIKTLKLLVLDETGQAFDLKTKKWEVKTKYRVCGLDQTGIYYSVSMTPEEFAAFDIVDPKLQEEDYPNLAGRTLNFIPFTFVNITNINPDVEKPPLLPLSNISLAIYRGDADYRQALFMQGQDTLFLAGIDLEKENVNVGPGACIHTPNSDAKAEYIGVSGQGLPEMRQSQDKLHELAQNMGVALIDQSTAESGEALKTRMAVKTAPMKNVALTGAAAIAQQLKFAATWAGSNPEEVEITPNLDFHASAITAQDVLSLWNAKLQGMPLSERSYHEWLRKNDFTDKDYDEEKEEMETEDSLNYANTQTDQNQDAS